MGEEQPIVADLEAMVQIADSGIVSKSIVENDHHKIILFCLARVRSSRSTRPACRR